MDLRIGQRKFDGFRVIGFVLEAETDEGDLGIIDGPIVVDGSEEGDGKKFLFEDNSSSLGADVIDEDGFGIGKAGGDSPCIEISCTGFFEGEAGAVIMFIGVFHVHFKTAQAFASDAFTFEQAFGHEEIAIAVDDEFLTGQSAANGVIGGVRPGLLHIRLKTGLFFGEISSC